MSLIDCCLQAKHWEQRLVSMKGAGYSQTQPITPYIHILLYHLPTLLSTHGSIKQFSGQGVEKKNDDYRRYFHSKINRWDACKSLLLVEKRQEALCSYERQARPYLKRDIPFWYEGGKRNAIQAYRQAAAAPPAPALPSPVPTNPTQALTSWTETDLRKKKVPELKCLLEELLGHPVPTKPLKKTLIADILAVCRQL